MADFSKEYCEKYDMGFKGDFSIIEEFNKLEEGWYISTICEGYGFFGIAKEDNELKLMFSKNLENGDIDLVDYEELNEHTYKKYEKR